METAWVGIRRSEGTGKGQARGSGQRAAVGGAGEGEQLEVGGPSCQLKARARPLIQHPPVHSHHSQRHSRELTGSRSSPRNLKTRGEPRADLRRGAQKASLETPGFSDYLHLPPPIFQETQKSLILKLAQERSSKSHTCAGLETMPTLHTMCAKVWASQAGVKPKG